MPSLNIEQFGDLLRVTLANYQKPDYVDLVADLTDYPAAKQLIKRSMMKLGDGKNCTWEVRVQTGNSFANVSPTEQDAVNIVDGFVEASVNWRQSKTGYAFLAHEMTINRGVSRIVDLIKSRENGAAFDFIKGMEENFWRFPAAADTLTPFGIPYWAPKNATEGFNGGLPTGYTTVAGLVPATYAAWNSYTAQYVAVTLDDMVKKMRTMAEKTDFKQPVEAVPDLGRRGKRGYYTNLSVKQAFEDAVDSRNDNLGPDLAKSDNTVMFRGVPVVYVPFLDGDTTNPLRQIDWNVFKIIVQNGWWAKRTVLAPWPGQRHMTGVFQDYLYNIVCFSRRLLGTIATGTSEPL